MTIWDLIDKYPGWSLIVFLVIVWGILQVVEDVALAYIASKQDDK